MLMYVSAYNLFCTIKGVNAPLTRKHNKLNVFKNIREDCDSLPYKCISVYAYIM